MNPHEAARRIVEALEELVEARAAVDPDPDVFDARDARLEDARTGLRRVIEKALSP